MSRFNRIRCNHFRTVRRGTAGLGVAVALLVSLASVRVDDAAAARLHVPPDPVPPTATATPGPAVPTVPVGPTPTLSLGKGYPEACPDLETRGVPKADIQTALGDPSHVEGWNRPANPNVPVSWQNPRRRRLTLRALGKPYNPLANGLVFKAGCP